MAGRAGQRPLICPGCGRPEIIEICDQLVRWYKARTRVQVCVVCSACGWKWYSQHPDALRRYTTQYGVDPSLRVPATTEALERIARDLLLARRHLRQVGAWTPSMAQVRKYLLAAERRLATLLELTA